MGTDIHAVAQAKKDGKWVDVSCNWEQNRHYMLFAWLGNVRNGYGFAGVITHAPITPLSNKRGFPMDFQVDGEMHGGGLAAEPDKWGDYEHSGFWMGYHSYSYVTGAEVLSAHKAPVERTGVISIEQYNDWDKQSPLTACSGGIAGPNIRVAPNPASIKEDTTYVQVKWVVSETDEFKYFTDEVQRLVDKHGEVRIVFGFDS